MALLTAVASGLTFVVGVLNKAFDWNLGLGIGGFDIELPQDFVGTMAVAIALLFLAGFFELIGNFQKVKARIKAHPLLFALSVIALGGAVLGGLYNIAGGPLGLAVESGDNEKVRSLLTEGEYPPSELGDHLYQTLKRNDLVASQLLLDAGADPNRFSGEFETPLLSSASIFFPKESVLWLLENGADPNSRDSMGRTAAINMLLYRSSYFPDESEQLEILEHLKSAGADFELEAGDGKSAKTLAREKKSKALEAFFGEEASEQGP
jgi:hypothetical protein